MRQIEVLRFVSVAHLASSDGEVTIDFFRKDPTCFPTSSGLLDAGVGERGVVGVGGGFIPPPVQACSIWG